MWSLADRSLRIPVFFVVLTGVPLAALVWLGWQFLQQDRDLEMRREREQLQNASELLVHDLHAALQSAEASLREQEGHVRMAPGKGTFFQIREGRVVNRSGVALPFYPVAARHEGQGAIFAAPERLEFDGRCDLALRKYRELAGGEDGIVRLGALMRVARCLRKLRRDDEALEIYRQLTSATGTTFGGMPAELVARRERVALMIAAGNDAAARTEKQQLRAALLTGAFTIDRGTFEFLLETLDEPPAPVPYLPLALAAESSASRWNGDTCGRLAGTFAGTPIVTLWCRPSNNTVNVMLVPADHWFGQLSPAASAMRVGFAVEDAAGSRVFNAAPMPPHGATLTRQLSDVTLPWHLRVTRAEPMVSAAHLWRRRAFGTSGLGLMVLTVAIAAFFVVRAVNRELATARLQADFIATVSHEFRTPLTAMNHLTEMLQEQAVPPERLPQYYGALHRETGRLQRVVEGLLDFKRFEGGRGAYRMEPMLAEDAVRQVLDGYATRDDSRRLHASLNAAAATILGDRQALAAAVSNLLDNAFKYSPADAPVSLTIEPRGAMVGISVEDRGPGMTRRERRQVFRKFVRGTAAREGNVKGTGIGLAIVAAVVKAHGGRVDLHTVPGHGSRFTLMLPVVEKR